ncbi:zinc finger protein 701 isoform X2 [Copidosoma floridanum]|nr:zinc finger protein 701 isoform X2 [Copidosoma floridanum]XP_014211932.1 zinc finger protein 701 isoform X2 [Copidosoma floridanum]XP_014211933.1 zinc finger protein 701 isoform X2 [Copidosoma floridanum]
MNFTEQSLQSALPQFSEISVRTTTPSYVSSSSDPLLSNHSTVYTTAADTNTKQIFINMHNKYQNTVLNLAEPNVFVQFCEKPNLQSLNIPACNQNNAILNVQSQILPMKIIQNMYVAQDGNIEKQDVHHVKNESEDTNNDHLSQQNLVIEYLQNIRSGALPLSLQQIIKIQSEQVKREKEDEPKSDQVQNNILNIPSVQIYKTALNDSSQFLSDNTVLTLNPNDVNIHMESQSENHSNVNTQTQTLTQNYKATQKVETGNSKPAKKTQFRAKMGEIKVILSIDGSPLYQCPECSSQFQQKVDINDHMQKHLMERKYKCTDCGAMLKRKEHLDQHIRGHSDERPFRCKVCPKAFKRNEHLTRHAVTHSGDKNYLCQICNKAFSRKDHLSKHTQTHLGIRKPKVKKVPSTVSNEASVTMNTTATTSMLLRPDLNNFLKEGSIKPESKTQQLFQQIQNMPDSSKLVFSMLHEHVFKDNAGLHHQAVNMNEILPQSTRYLAPS